MKTFDYQPGNGTRYFLLFGPAGDPGDRLLVWLRRSDVGGSAFRHRAGMGPVAYDYLMEKMDLNSTADAAALLGFLAKQGVEVWMPEGYDARGLWDPSLIPMSGGAA